MNEKKRVRRSSPKVTKPRTTRRPRKNRTEQSKLQILIIAALALVVFVGLASSLVYYFDNQEKGSAPSIGSYTQANHTKPLEESNKTIFAQDNATIDSGKNNSLITMNTTLVTSNKSEIQVGSDKIAITTNNDKKPYLVIIIDDVVHKSHVDKIMSIPLKLTPSFLPSTTAHPNTHNYVKYTKSHMVHLPLEAIFFKNSEENTLLVSDSYEVIYSKLQRIKKLFPNTIFYNNHTGSRFTSNYEAMEKLFQAMNELGLIFVDSRTTSNTKAPQLAKKYNQKLLVRDVFLDHEINVPYIRNQLNIAISTAKKNGFAITIGHPHKETLSVLRESVERLNFEVEVIYLEDLYYATN